MAPAAGASCRGWKGTHDGNGDVPRMWRTPGPRRRGRLRELPSLPRDVGWLGPIGAREASPYAGPDLPPEGRLAIVALLLGSWLLVGAIGLQWADSLTGGSNSAWAALIFGPAILGALAIWGVVLVVLVVGLAVALATRHDAMPPPAR